MPFYTKDLSFLRFCYLQGSWNQSPRAAEGPLYLQTVQLFNCYFPTVLFKVGFPGGSVVKNPSANPGDEALILVWRDPLEKETATHSSSLSWATPWTEAPGELKESDMTATKQQPRQCIFILPLTTFMTT